MKLESIFQYLDGFLLVEGYPDYPQALNGVQVDGPGEVERVVVAVDASEATINEAVKRGADLLIVHHGVWRDPVLGFGHCSELSAEVGLVVPRSNVCILLCMSLTRTTSFAGSLDRFGGNRM